MMVRMKIPYVPETPSPPQERFLDLKPYEGLFGGGMASGKTSVILYGAFQHIMTPGFNALILTHKYEDILGPGGIGQRALGWLDAYEDGLYVWDPMMSRIVVSGGGTINFGFFDQPHFEERWRASRFQYIGIDDAHKGLRRDGYRYMLSRLRGIDRNDPTPLKIRLAANPHEGWIKQDFIKDDYRGRPHVAPSVWSNPGVDGDEYAKVMKDIAFDSLEKELKGDWS